MSRLTKAIKQEIIDNIVFEKINPRKKKLEADIREQVQQALNGFFEAYPDNVKKWLLDAPEGCALTCNTTSVVVLGDNNGRDSGCTVFEVRHEDKHGLYQHEKRYNLEKFIPILDRDFSRVSRIQINADSKIGKTLMVLKKIKESIEKDESSMTNTINSALDSCDTIVQLKKYYPDLNKYVPLPEPSTKPLAILNADITKCLNNMGCG